MKMSEVICALCNEGFSEESPPVSVKEKGLRTIIRVCKERELDDLSRFTYLGFPVSTTQPLSMKQ